eukprot:SAG25_NODE_494_length_7404_cov_2.579603_2_plen_107_part_00
MSIARPVTCALLLHMYLRAEGHRVAQVLLATAQAMLPPPPLRLADQQVHTPRIQAACDRTHAHAASEEAIIIIASWLLIIASPTPTAGRHPGGHARAVLRDHCATY